MSRLWYLPAMLSIALNGCTSTAARPEASIDFMFRRTSAVEDRVVSLAQPSLVNELNGAFSVSDIGFHPRSALGSTGSLTAGEGRVFVLDFVDHGDIAILRSDDKRLSLRAELGPDGSVTRAILGAPLGHPRDGLADFENDFFESGTWQLLYDGPDIVVGRLDLKFRKYTVRGNFRAPRVR